MTDVSVMNCPLGISSCCGSGRASRIHTKRLSADGILSALANRISLTLAWVGATPFTRPTSEEPDLKTSPLGDKIYA